VFGSDVEVVIIDRETNGPADTVNEMISRASVTGAIAIKDCDSFFDPLSLTSGTFVGVVDVRTAETIQRLGAKSYARLNENGLVIELVEKSIVSNFVCVGIYGFSSAAGFRESFDAVRSIAGDAEVFVSHVMNETLQRGDVVQPLYATNLIDVGTLDDWRNYVRKHATIVTDIDGVVFLNQSKYFPPYWTESEVSIASNVRTLLELQAAGAQIVFMTSRPEAMRAKTTAALESTGLKVHALVMGCLHGRRFLVNDYSGTNPHPSAVGLSVPRNTESLSDLISEWVV
jgi:hypothetical protein